MFKSKQILGAELCMPIRECTGLSCRKLLSVAAFLLGLALQALLDFVFPARCLYPYLLKVFIRTMYYQSLGVRRQGSTFRQGSVVSTYQTCGL